MNPEYHMRTKHFNIQLYAVCNYVNKELIELIYVPTDSNLADIFMKALTRDRFGILREGLGVYPR